MGISLIFGFMFMYQKQKSEQSNIIKNNNTQLDYIMEKKNCQMLIIERWVYLTFSYSSTIAENW